MYLFAQALGIVASVIAIIASQMSKKWQILLISMFANFLSVIVFLLLDDFGSAVSVNIIAVVQCAINAILSYKGREASIIQKAIFMSLFLISGILGYKVPLDIIPIVASLVFAWSTFQKKEQHIRMFRLVNVILWIVYDSIVGITAVFGQIFSLISILVALYRYRKQISVKDGKNEYCDTFS